MLLRALSKDPTERFDDCAAFVRELENAFQSSRLRLFREKLAEIRALLEAGEAARARQLFTEAQAALPNHTEALAQLAELEPQLLQAEHYQAGMTAWGEARQMGQAVLDRLPAFPDPDGIFPPLELRAPVRARRTPREVAQLAASGLLIGLPLAFLLIRLAISWIERW